MLLLGPLHVQERFGPTAFLKSKGKSATGGNTADDDDADVQQAATGSVGTAKGGRVVHRNRPGLIIEADDDSEVCKCVLQASEQLTS